jgi:hypothetical protein
MLQKTQDQKYFSYILAVSFINTQFLLYLTEILWDHKFLSDVTGCRKTQVSDCTSCTVIGFEHIYKKHVLV